MRFSSSSFGCPLSFSFVGRCICSSFSTLIVSSRCREAKEGPTNNGYVQLCVRAVSLASGAKREMAARGDVLPSHWTSKTFLHPAGLNLLSFTSPTTREIPGRRDAHRQVANITRYPRNCSTSHPPLPAHASSVILSTATDFPTHA